MAREWMIQKEKIRVEYKGQHHAWYPTFLLPPDFNGSVTATLLTDKEKADGFVTDTERFSARDTTFKHTMEALQQVEEDQHQRQAAREAEIARTKDHSRTLTSLDTEWAALQCVGPYVLIPTD